MATVGEHIVCVIMVKINGGFDGLCTIENLMRCAEGAHALASAYQKLFRRHTHLE